MKLINNLNKGSNKIKDRFIILLRQTNLKVIKYLIEIKIKVKLSCQDSKLALKVLIKSTMTLLRQLINKPETL